MRYINVIVEDAEPGSYVEYPVKKATELKSFPLRDFERAKKIVLYIDENGDIEKRGIGEDEWLDRKMICKKDTGTYYKHLWIGPEISLLNTCLRDMFLDEILEEIEKGIYIERSEDMSELFKDLLKHLGEWDNTTEPKPWGKYGFIYDKREEDGHEWYELCGIGGVDEHKMIE